MLPLGLISNLRSTSLVSFCICALTSWQSLQKGRASHSLAQWSISANYIPAVFAFWQHLYSIHRDPAFSGFWIFLIALHRKTIYFISWSQIPIHIYLTATKLLESPLQNVFWYFLFYLILFLNIQFWTFHLQLTEMILWSEHELWPRKQS